MSSPARRCSISRTNRASSLDLGDTSTRDREFLLPDLWSCVSIPHHSFENSRARRKLRRLLPHPQKPRAHHRTNIHTARRPAPRASPPSEIRTTRLPIFVTCTSARPLQFPSPLARTPAARDRSRTRMIEYRHRVCRARQLDRLPLPRPHAQVPDRCPHCGSRDLSRKGTRRKKFETVQLWRCRACRRVFTPAPARFATRPIPSCDPRRTHVYDLGYTLEDTRKKLNAGTDCRFASSSVSMVSEHKNSPPTGGSAPPACALPATQTVRAIKLYHRKSITSPITARSSRFCEQPRASPLRETCGVSEEHSTIVSARESAQRCEEAAWRWPAVDRWCRVRLGGKPCSRRSKRTIIFASVRRTMTFRSPAISIFCKCAMARAYLDYKPNARATDPLRSLRSTACAFKAHRHQALRYQMRCSTRTTTANFFPRKLLAQ